MNTRISAIGASLAIAAGGLAAAGCGSSGPSHQTTSHSASASAASPLTSTLPGGRTLVEAADRIDRTPGYRLRATIDISVGSQPVSIAMSGVVERHGTVAALRTVESVAGHRIDLQMRVAGQTYYMTGIPGMSAIAAGRHWVSIDYDQIRSAEGLGGLQTGATTNPAQFVSYLRSVGAGVTRVATATIDGASTTEYRATIDLDRYPGLLPASRRAAARRSIARLETEIGGHTVPVTVWVDRAHEVRQMHLALPICAAGHHLSLSMTMDLSDFGHVAPVAIPAAADTQDITRTIRSVTPSAQSATAGCPSAG